MQHVIPVFLTPPQHLMLLNSLFSELDMTRETLADVSKKWTTKQTDLLRKHISDLEALREMLEAIKPVACDIPEFTEWHGKNAASLVDKEVARLSDHKKECRHALGNGEEYHNMVTAANMMTEHHLETKKVIVSLFKLLEIATKKKP